MDRRRNAMKVVILAGGFGTRISEESHLKPKPMIEIGEQPILWHIMKHYSQYGFNDFVICLGYKQYVVKEYFADYFLHTSDVTFDLAKNEMQVHNNYSEPWRVTLVDTGLHTMTGGRIKRIRDYIGDETFMLTYGDGVSNVDLDALGYIDPDISVNIIKDGKLVEKRKIELPERLVGIKKCTNPRCITTTEQGITHIFKLTDREKRIYRCIYCEADK